MDTSEYESQLLIVEQELLATEDEEKRSELQALKRDLVELLELTKQTLETGEDNAGSADEMDAEMARFVSEMRQIDTATTQEVVECPEETPDIDEEHKLQLLKTKFEGMIGEKCSAPHEHAWGSVTYHNAIICGIDELAQVESDGSLDVQLRVLFTNPTHREMLPCSYFLEGECRFDEARCHYSHGELVSAQKLREYTAPDFGRLARNCVVLAKLQDRLWHRGRVLCVNFVEKICRVRLDGKEHKDRERDFDFEHLFPIFHDEDLSSGSSSDSSVSSDSEEIDDAARCARLIEQSLFTCSPTQALGEWEKHTRGIGSKLMSKMGYVLGTGLGSDGRGIITPISAQILPQGCSLNYCMELREAANGDKDLFSVERKLHREKKKQQALNVKAYERESQRVDVFSFLNDSILSTQNTAEGSNTKNTPKPNVQEHTTKSLNVESVRVADDIRRKEREIAKVQQSMRRNASGTEVHKRLQTQLDEKTSELGALQREERILSKEQATRRTKDKLSVF